MINFIKSIYKKLDCFGLTVLAMTWHYGNYCATSLRAKAKQSSFLIFILLFASPVFAFQDCIVTNDGKLTDISIRDNTIIDVYPLITVMNEKNTLIVHPLKEGTTKFCVLKNDKDIVMFDVVVTDNKTIIDQVEGFDVFTIDTPGNYDDEVFELDKPPV